MTSTQVLIFSNKDHLIELCSQELKKNSYQVHIAKTWRECLKFLQENPIHIGITDSDSIENSSARWILLTNKKSQLNLEQVSGLGVLQILPQDFQGSQLIKALEYIEKALQDPFFELLATLESITGVQLVKEKNSLVQSRLQRRLTVLGIHDFRDYVQYFHAHRAQEIPEVISLVTTHTTEFFREEKHFDKLFENIFPKIFAHEKEINIWSAASSTGQEAYSLAIATCEFLDTHFPGPQTHRVKIYGTDIDTQCLKVAKDGIYKKELIENLSPSLIKKYFDVGTGELSEYVRIKDFIHEMCDFSKMNLLTDDFSLPQMDLVFLRNVLIYFSPEGITQTMNKISKVMKPHGLLFLGHSESLNGLKTPFKNKGSSIYSLDSFSKSMSEEFPPITSIRSSVPKTSLMTPKSLILIGSSTGGVEALGVLLKNFTKGCPPVLIVQHIPSHFSQALAKRLNETCQIQVREAQNGDLIQASHAYIAPGGKQMRIVNNKNQLYIEINDDPARNQHKPSVDYLFESALPLAGKMHLTAAILTGMGSDGAENIKKLHDLGVYTVAQDEKSSVVYGMPAAAAKLGGASKVLPLTEIADSLLGYLKRKTA